MKSYLVEIVTTVPAVARVAIVAESQEAAEALVRADLDQNAWASLYWRATDYAPDWTCSTPLEIISPLTPDTTTP